MVILVWAGKLIYRGSSKSHRTILSGASNFRKRPLNKFSRKMRTRRRQGVRKRRITGHRAVQQRNSPLEARIDPKIIQGVEDKSWTLIRPEASREPRVQRGKSPHVSGRFDGVRMRTERGVEN